jgi:hypothetical protein
MITCKGILQPHHHLSSCKLQMSDNNSTDDNQLTNDQTFDDRTPTEKAVCANPLRDCIFLAEWRLPGGWLARAETKSKGKRNVGTSIIVNMQHVSRFAKAKVLFFVNFLFRAKISHRDSCWFLYEKYCRWAIMSEVVSSPSDQIDELVVIADL